MLFSCGLLHVHGEILSAKHQTQQGLSHAGLRTCLRIGSAGFFSPKKVHLTKEHEDKPLNYHRIYDKPLANHFFIVMINVDKL